jgi:hypothetical protein
VCTVRGRTGESLAVHRNRKMKFWVHPGGRHCSVHLACHNSVPVQVVGIWRNRVNTVACSHVCMCAFMYTHTHMEKAYWYHVGEPESEFQSGALVHTFSQKSASLFLKGWIVNITKLFWSHSLCCICPAPPLLFQSSHRWCFNEWVWPYCNKSLFIKSGRRPDLL